MNETAENNIEKGKEKQTKPAEKKAGLIRSERSHRPLLKGHVTHLINHG
ncbi:MAG: hypothetical protein ACTTH7_03730 [Treponema sp.]